MIALLDRERERQEEATSSESKPVAGSGKHAMLETLGRRGKLSARSFEGRKAMREYLAVIHKDPDHGYAVTFPDFPGLTTFAAFLDGAPDVAASHLTIHLDEAEQAGATLPKASSFETIARDPLYVDRVATVSLKRSDLFWVVSEVTPAAGESPANDDVRI